jgi:hypothetical protein
LPPFERRSGSTEVGSRGFHYRYDGKVQTYDVESGICEVRYDNGERQIGNLLKQTKYKCKAKPGSKAEELIDRMRANDGEESKQLKDIDPRLPCYPSPSPSDD